MGTASPDLSRPVKSTVGDRQGEALEREIGTTTSNVRDRDLGLVAVEGVLRAPARAHPGRGLVFLSSPASMFSSLSSSRSSGGDRKRSFRFRGSTVSAPSETVFACLTWSSPASVLVKGMVWAGVLFGLPGFRFTGSGAGTSTSAGSNRGVFRGRPRFRLTTSDCCPSWTAFTVTLVITGAAAARISMDGVGTVVGMSRNFLGRPLFLTIGSTFVSVSSVAWASKLN